MKEALMKTKSQMRKGIMEYAIPLSVLPLTIFHRYGTLVKNEFLPLT